MARNEKEKLLSLQIWGLVQGIGFRPFIARIASEHKMIGRVLNQNGCVKVEVIGREDKLEAFYNDILLKKPLAAKYISINKSYSSIIDAAIDTAMFNNKFTIEQSQAIEGGAVFPTPDFSICDECEKELFAKDNRRFLHPFISCAECGPRYTILKGTPYDRITTTMSDFPMCAACESEYNDKDSRRMHAQTLACHDCGPKLSYVSRCDEVERIFLDKVGRINQDKVGRIEQDEVGHIDKYEVGRIKQDESEQINKFKVGRINQDEKAALNFAIDDLKSGRIIAIKGIGGYHLACTPFSDDSVQRLRDLKGRENKPFAVMFSSLEELEIYCNFTPKEKENLTSTIKPIVLLKPKHFVTPSISTDVSRSSRFLGSFLPYTPLHHLILKETGPLVMTSANFTDSPIIKDDAQMLEFFRNQTDLTGILKNDRLILRRIDDSVVQCIGDITQIIRRARGYVPNPITLDQNQTREPKTQENQIQQTRGQVPCLTFAEQISNPKQTGGQTPCLVSANTGPEPDVGTDTLSGVRNTGSEQTWGQLPCPSSEQQPCLATEQQQCPEPQQSPESSPSGEQQQCLALGGQQKNTFCLATEGFYFLSTDNGDLDSLSSFENYKKSLDEMKNLLNIKPTLICADLHPGYQTSRFAKALGMPVKLIQHHYAHVASVMAEGNLTEPVIGVAFDGTGYGTDGTLWGGEFLIAKANGFDRVGHLKTISLLGGDASVRDTQKIATCLLHAANLDNEISDSRKQTICSALDAKINTIESSSIGRMFDAVCSILNISHIATYEGECAIMLENEAAKAIEIGVTEAYKPYNFTLIEMEGKIVADIVPCIREIIQDMKNTIPVPQIAYRFHATIAELIVNMCIEVRKRSGIRTVALSGGVFQNRILLQLAIEKLQNIDFIVYINRQVPPNDAGISLGQAYVAQCKLGSLRMT